METRILQTKEIIRGYDAVVPLYPHIPPLSHWRAFEHAAYQHCSMNGRVLDLGCGDGKYFRLIWPTVTDVVGIDMEPNVAELGRQSGVYSAVHVTYAHEVPEPKHSFDHVFANCSLEHMDKLDIVLKEINRCLKPGGTLVCSVVTNRFVEWALLPNMVAMAGHQSLADHLRREFLDYHHLANPLTVEQWVGRLRHAGLEVEIHMPIIPKVNSGMFLLMDNLWHVKRTSGGELGDIIYPFLSANEWFPGGFRKVFEGLLDMETDWHDACGAVFVARKLG